VSVPRARDRDNDLPGIPIVEKQFVVAEKSMFIAVLLGKKRYLYGS
jgi:hypothetical protein